MLFKLPYPNQTDGRFDLRAGLSTLPKPRNDYEIVIPDGEDDDGVADGDNEEFVEDAEDVEMRRAEVRNCFVKRRKLLEITIG